jgi:hypothetical protein
LIGQPIYAGVSVLRRWPSVRDSAFVSGIGSFEHDDGRIDQLFAGVLEIDRDAMAVDRLHLSNTPFRTLGMNDKIAGREPSTTAIFTGIQWLRCLSIFMYSCMVGTKGRYEKLRHSVGGAWARDLGV